MKKITSGLSATFFIDGPGGTGKTFSYKALLTVVRSQNSISLAIASSGVSASLLPRGRTAHSRFKIPLEIIGEVRFSVSMQPVLGILLKMCKLIIWYEAHMVNRCIVEAVDKMLRDINDCDLPFGGKVIVLGGDFRQILPVVPRGKKEDIMKIPGQIFMYYSFDETIDKSEQSFEEDFLNSLTSNGIPPYELNLKINCHVMLLRNINPSEGLCNGTRLTCRNFEKNVILAEIKSGEYCGKQFHLNIISTTPVLLKMKKVNLQKMVHKISKMAGPYKFIRQIAILEVNWSAKMVIIGKQSPKTTHNSTTRYQNIVFMDLELKLGKTPVIWVTNLNVSSFNGIILSTKVNSTFFINSDLLAIANYRNWTEANKEKLDNFIENKSFVVVSRPKLSPPTDDKFTLIADLLGLYLTISEKFINVDSTNANMQKLF
ncbi:uncharacterized protein LOC111406581 [Olea europaea var. sylvestris]|uniref:uncharacterized protein LOC111406581 n=1 Tax=Olea europaea var. sylvestris TaxID=158386 RepID=UPI000C1CE832|nr:uncharacterized protein LOC111406581 [Olea europaea var. sylvestris]